MIHLPKFAVGDKVTHKLCPSYGVLEVTRVGKEIDYPGKGPARKVTWVALNPELDGLKEWTWDFALEIW